MALMDAPRLYINGQEISGTRTRTEPVALAGLACTWGRDSPYDDAEPATLDAEILDPSGDLAGTDLTGAPVTVMRGDGKAIFRGSINDHSATLVWLADPVTGERRRTWLVTISAADVLAELAQAILPGPGNNAVTAAELGPNYWETQSPAARIAAIVAAGANELVAGIDWVNPYPTGSYYPLVRFREMADQLSALQMIEAVYNSWPLAWVRYDANDHRIRIGRPASITNIELVLRPNGTMALYVPDGHNIPARVVQVPEGLTAQTTIDKGIGVVQVTVPQLSPETEYDIVDSTTEVKTAHASGSKRGRKTYAVTNDVFYNHPSQGAAAWQQSLAQDARDMVNQINGMLDLPLVRFDFAKLDFTDTFAIERLLDASPFPAPFYFTGSAFAQLQRAGAAHQLIGGRWSWQVDDGVGHWVSDVRLVPALGSGTGVTIAQLVTHPDPTLADFANDLTVADLGNVTKGLAA